jgi:hypothetical protein
MVMARKNHSNFILGLVIALTPSVLYSQETASSLLKVQIANIESIENYDVTFQHWSSSEFQKEAVAALPEALRNKVKKTDIEVHILGRVLFDRLSQRCLYIERKTLGTGTTSPSFRYLWWEGGKGVEFTESNDVPSQPGKTFDDFRRFGAVPALEFGAVSSFPPVSPSGNLAEHFSEWLRTYEGSKLERTSTGSLRSVLSSKNTEHSREGSHPNVITTLFDPVSSMPTEIISTVNDSETGEVIQEIQRIRPSTEKCKGVYRLKSINYSRKHYRSFEGYKLLSENSGVAFLHWAQFNEDGFAFPKLDVQFDLDLAKSMLGEYDSELSK